MGEKCVLDESGLPRVENDVLAWAHWYETANRSLARTVVGKSTVSTVFLGLDHNFAGGPDPVLWETYVFDAPDSSDHMRRYTSPEAAIVGHRQVVLEIEALTAPAELQ